LFKGVYIHLTSIFFHSYLGTSVVEAVWCFQSLLVAAFEKKDTQGAVRTMSVMLKHGETYLRGDQP
jgi:hypothetical protein